MEMLTIENSKKTINLENEKPINLNHRNNNFTKNGKYVLPHSLKNKNFFDGGVLQNKLTQIPESLLMGAF